MAGATDSRKRKRGIRASRVKLEKALVAAGIKTQAALAEKMAEQEGNVSVPKDLVNRAFREQPVSPGSMERIAAALGTEAYTLYLSQNDEPLSQALVEQQLTTATEPGKKLSILVPVFGAVILLLACAIAYTLLKPDVSTNSDVPLWYAELPTKLGHYSLSLTASPVLLDSLKTLPKQLAGEFNVVPNILPLDGWHTPNNQMIAQKQVDFIVSLEAREVGRYLWLVASLITETQHHFIQQWAMRADQWPKQSAQIKLQLTEQLKALLIDNRPAVQLPVQDQLLAMQFYLEGRQLLEQSSDLNKVKGAQSRFLAALKLSPNDALSLAGLCQAYLFESWNGNEKHLLTEAQLSCDQALQISESPFVLASQGFLKRRTGQLEQSLPELLSSAERHPESAALWQEIALTELELFRQNGQPDSLLDEAKQHIEQAIALRPDDWRSHLNLGLIEWSRGDKQAALAANQQAVVYDENDLVLTNLGTLSFCLGEVDQANEYYHKALQREPDSYLALEMISMLEYFDQRYESALAYRLASMTALGDANVHQMYGALGDLYVLVGDSGQARQSYQQALLMIDRDYARGNNSLTDQAHEFYYKLRLNALSAPEATHYPISVEKINQLREQANSLDSSAVIRLALVYRYLHLTEQASQMMALASSRCIIYERIPEWFLADELLALSRPE